MPQSSTDSVAGYLAEYSFLGEGIRQMQRERHKFLAFSLAASGLILSLLMRSTPPRSPTETCFLVGLAAGVTLIAERMTIRASYSIAVDAAYLRLFVEPQVDGLDFQRRLASPLRTMKGVASTSHSFALAYTALTAAFVLAWFAAPIDGARQWWQTVLIGILTAASFSQVAGLTSISRFHWDGADPWRDLHEEEHGASTIDEIKPAQASRR
jgi:hypothetical protein